VRDASAVGRRAGVRLVDVDRVEVARDRRELREVGLGQRLRELGGLADLDEEASRHPRYTKP
jgi:hypothetical protein